MFKLNIDTEEESYEDDISTKSVMPSDTTDNDIPELILFLSPTINFQSPKRNEIKKEILSSSPEGNKYYKKIQEIIKNIEQYPYPLCKLNVSKKDLLSGAYSIVDVDSINNVVYRQSSIFENISKLVISETYKLHNESIIKKLIVDLMEIKNICIILKKNVDKLNKIFPINSVFMKDCTLCKTKNKIKIEMTNGLAKGKNYHTLLKNKKLSNDDILKLEMQLVYIAKTLNKKYNLYHNDYAARNIMIDVSKKVNIDYTQGKYKLSIKNTFLPVLIDYDFIRDKFLDITEGMNDEDIDVFITDGMKNKILYKLSEINDLYDNDDITSLNKYHEDIFFKSNMSGGGKGGHKNKKKKSIRKHSGINQKTGKLKKGFKYSGKTLKSGLKEIKEIKKLK